MKLKHLFLFLAAFMLFGIITNKTYALEDTVDDEDEGYVLVARTDKYYKTVYTYNIDLLSNIHTIDQAVTSVTYEITEEEFNNARKEDSIIRSNPTVIENTYKHMITSIYANGSNYRYKNVLSWKIIPTLRSYDIIGIGFLTSVEPAAAPGFKQEYCLTYGGCHMSTLNTPQYFNTGAGASFKLISGDLSSLKATFYFDVKKKNPNSTVTFQMAYGDYAHATSETGLISSTYYEVVQSLGIVLDSSISSSYDSIQEADAAWYGTW